MNNDKLYNSIRSDQRKVKYSIYEDPLKVWMKQWSIEFMLEHLEFTQTQINRTLTLFLLNLPVLQVINTPPSSPFPVPIKGKNELFTCSLFCLNKLEITKQDKLLHLPHYPLKFSDLPLVLQ
ncbi:MAG: hypothetical protein R3321_10250, partial [Nitrososphaeraceae archaeon]|nr:hypothetical protein [Nitrososphaeraceae archaeon]